MMLTDLSMCVYYFHVEYVFFINERLIPLVDIYQLYRIIFYMIVSPLLDDAWNEGVAKSYAVSADVELFDCRFASLILHGGKFSRSYFRNSCWYDHGCWLLITWHNEKKLAALNERECFF